MAGFVSRLKDSYNVLMDRASLTYDEYSKRRTSDARSGSFVVSRESLLTPIITRVGMDASSLKIQHVLTKDDFYVETIQSSLNKRLTRRANKDQPSRMFVQSAVATLMNKGVIAIVPVETSVSPRGTTKYSIDSLRVATITQWFAEDVELEVYNDRSGMREQIVLPKSFVAVVENPLYDVMNGTNSTLTRLVEKLRLLDSVDKQSGSGKLDLLIQLPFAIRSTKREEQAEARRKALEGQLMDSKYGIGYVDATEKVTQLNRPVENQLMAQVEYLTRMLYSQLGISMGVFDGSASEEEMLAYYNRTVFPLVNAVTDSMYTTFLTDAAMDRGERLMYFNDPFKMAPVSEIADSMDKFSRNEIITGNEGRAYLGLKPNSDPEADKLRNKNINDNTPKETPPDGIPKKKEK